MSKICQNCGHENRDVAIFCGNCGTRLIAQNLASNLTGSSGNDGNSASTDNAGAGLCCAVLIILFIILLIMSGG